MEYLVEELGDVNGGAEYKKRGESGGKTNSS